MPRKLNPDYIRRIVQKDELRGLEVVYLTGEQFGVSDEHPSGGDIHIRDIGRGISIVKAGNYQGWTVPCRMYCTRCWSPLVGTPRDIIQRNWCDSCKSELYSTEDEQRLDMLGYDIYRQKVIRYMGIAVRHFSELIEGSERILPNNCMQSGFHKDHIYSVLEGFENDVDEFVISSPPNIRVLQGRKNIAKGRNSGYTLEQLLGGYNRFLLDHPEWLELVAESDEREESFTIGG